MTQGPRGWRPGLVEHREQRFVGAGAAPQSYDPETRSVTATLSVGSPVQRFYGQEKLRVDARSVNLDRVNNGGVALLDSHNQASITNSLGRVSQAWFGDQGGERALLGRLTFNSTAEGRKAEDMIRRGEINSISVGYRVDAWEIEDADGNVIKPDKVRWDDSDLTFTATRWELLEASLVAVPADGSASIRALNGRGFDVDGVRMRMLVRERMHARQRLHNAQAARGARDDE